ncbi:hypothetical protein ACFL01_02590 [Planctomycetota bacterium]
MFGMPCPPRSSMNDSTAGRARRQARDIPEEEGLMCPTGALTVPLKVPPPDDAMLNLLLCELYQLAGPLSPPDGGEMELSGRKGGAI